LAAVAESWHVQTLLAYAQTMHYFSIAYLGSSSASIIAIQRFDRSSGDETQSQIAGVGFGSIKEKKKN
jgi:hypothetical protein